MESCGAFWSMKNKTIWIDLDNSPHVPFFAPIIDELRRRGHKVAVSARAAYQVGELADRMCMEYSMIGKHYGKHRLFKVLGTCLRVVQLLPFVLRHRPSLAVSHGSRAQTIICSLLKIRTLGILDYEFARSVGPFRSKWLLVPSILPDCVLNVRRRVILRYPGIKEDVYVPRFVPDPSIRDDLRLGHGNLIVTLRPPATEAHYHARAGESLYDECVKYLGEHPNISVVLLPRNSRQAAAARSAWPQLFAVGKIIIPGGAVDGLNLIWHSDLVISGGGTMNREAAALGVPVYSIFCGSVGTVDRYLAEQQRLVMVRSVGEVRAKIKLCKRERAAELTMNSSSTLHSIVDHIVTLATT